VPAAVKNRRNYYRVLQVQPDAAADVVKASYRTLMQKLRLHPDLGGDEGHAALINEAYAVLSDPQRRAQYDAAGEARRMGLGPLGRTPGRGPDPPRQPPRARAPAWVCQPLVCVLCHAPSSITLNSTGPRRCHACDSPLTPVAGAGSGTQRERSVPRIERHAALRYARAVPLGAAGNGLLEDLSSHGLRFVTDRALAVRELLRIECELLGAVARVVSCRMQREPPGSHAVGVAFITVDYHRSRGSLLAVEA
jgi:hypothetical protein